METKKTYHDYDLLRLLAILFVVIGHSSYLGITVESGGVDYALPAVLSPAYDFWFTNLGRFLHAWVYGFHMPLFFILSGAVFSIAPIQSFDALCAKKCRRLVVPYFVYGVLFMLPVKYLGNFYNRTNINDAYLSFLRGATLDTFGF